MNANNSTISVILPTFNERDNIIPLIESIHTQLRLYDHEIIVVDDSSSDGTFEMLSSHGFSQVKAIQRKEDPGLALSIREGIEKSRGEIIIVMDSDFNHDPAYLPEMLENITDHDCVCASRFISGGGMYSRTRHFLSYLFNFFIRTMTGISTSDNLFGLFAIKRSSLEKCPYDAIFYGFGDFYIRLLFCLNKIGADIYEIPAFHNKRRSGQSTNSLLRTFFQYFIAVLRLSFKRLK